MERQAIAYLCIDIHDFNEELLLEYAEIGDVAVQIANERLDFNKQIVEIDGLFYVLKNKEATKIIQKFKKYVSEILTILKINGLDVTLIHKKYQEKMNKLEISANLLFDKISEKKHTPDIFDDDIHFREHKHDDSGIELQQMDGRNKLSHLPPIINAPKLNKWKNWRQKRRTSDKPNVKKTGYHKFD